MGIPSACTAGSPPSRSLISEAIRRASPRSSVSSWMFHAMRNGRAPTTVAPAVGCARRGPESGAPSVAASAADRPSKPGRRMSASTRRSGRLAARAYRYTGRVYRSASQVPKSRASPTHTSMGVPPKGTKGTTSRAPMRGCRPCCERRSMRAMACAATSCMAASTAAASPANVSTLRSWSASEVRSSSVTPGMLSTAAAIASTISGRRPSLMLGTHSTSCSTDPSVGSADDPWRAASRTAPPSPTAAGGRLPWDGKSATRC